MMNPPFKTARAWSELFTVQCCQWEPIQNGQQIRIYKEIPVQIYKHTDTKDRYKGKVSFTWVKLTFPLYLSRMAILYCYWHVVIKNGNFTLLLTSSGQEWHFCHEIDRKTFILRVNLGMWPLKSIIWEKRALFWGFQHTFMGFPSR